MLKFDKEESIISTVSRKKLVLVLIAVVLVLASSYILMRPATKIDIDKFSQAMLASPVYYKDMEELDISKIKEHYVGVTVSDISSAKVFVSKDGTTREWAIIEATTSQSADAIQKAVSAYCNELVKKYRLENKEEYERLRGYVIRRTRNYVILTISDSTRSGNQLVEAYLDKINYDKRS
jgi:Na+-transporting NADH:ubiquinone oxidoreductase subunit NqrC